MDNEILVKEFRKILRILKQDKGHVSLFMLKAFDADITDWNLIVSMLEYDHLTTKKAIKHLVNILNNNLSRSILRKIIRVTILKTTDPFVEEMHRAYNVINTEKYIQSSVMLGVYIERAIIFESHSVNSIERKKSATNEIISNF